MTFVRLRLQKLLSLIIIPYVPVLLGIAASHASPLALISQHPLQAQLCEHLQISIFLIQTPSTRPKGVTFPIIWCLAIFLPYHPAPPHSRRMHPTRHCHGTRECLPLDRTLLSPPVMEIRKSNVG
jgi:hypothetical protein